MLMYLFSTLDRLLLTNAIGLSMLLSGTTSLGHLVPLFVYSRTAPSPTPEASISMYNGFVSSWNFIKSFSFMIDFAFQVHSVLANVNFLSALQTSALLEYILLK